ncbi:tripartite tricarboxylate transporter substrate binding protein [Pseudoroseomonas cervicalis]|uniref:tripartite tricarboxylate transporter substrate binding protein n=1 Tax=Teichococcus cervicalis TaxID=204525 RepID=UPI0035EC48A5
MTTRRHLLRAAPLALAAATAPALPRPALAAWPERGLRLVVAFPPGGGVDRVARLVQPRLAEFLGQPVVVENRGGGAGMIALNSVAAAPADGHTVLIDDLSFLVAPLLAVTGPAAYPVGFTPVGALAEMPVLLAASRRSGITSLDAYLDAARLAELPLAYGTPGIGSIGHVAGALLGRRTGLRFQHVPYRGSADLVRDLAGGRLDSAYLTPAAFLPLAAAGRAAPLAMSSGTWQGLPADLPQLDRFGPQGREEGAGQLGCRLHPRRDAARGAADAGGGAGLRDAGCGTAAHPGRLRGAAGGRHAARLPPPPGAGAGAAAPAGGRGRAGRWRGGLRPWRQPALTPASRARSRTARHRPACRQGRR